MRRNPERTAWAVLVSAFVTFCALAVAIPLSLRWWLRTASTPQTIFLESTGTVIVTLPGGNIPVVNPETIPPGSKIVTQPDSQARLTFAALEGGEALATVQVYGGAELTIPRADRPRYGAGVNPSRIDLDVTSGRLRATLLPDVSRPVKIQIFSAPQALTVLDAAGSSVSLEAGADQTVAAVREGRALLIARSQSEGITVEKDQRGEVVANEPPRGPLPSERNWIVNGNFEESLESGWAKEIRPPQIIEEDWGTASVVEVDGRRAAQFLRFGKAWGQAGIAQAINRDVTDFNSLRLHLAVRANLQDLWNCGGSGTECPVMVDITFLDQSGGERHWLKGFFYNFNANPGLGLTSCPSCNAVSSDHERVPAGEWITYDSPNLLEALRSGGVNVKSVKSISIYGAGHIFDGLVTEVELLAEE
jgi:hypothetical protein